MKSNCDFVERIRIVFHPVADVAQKLVQVRLNAVARNTQITLRHSIFSRPTPHMIEHPPMQATQKCLAHDVSLALECPTFGYEDVLLLRLVQLSTHCDVRRNQAITFLRR